MGRGRDLDLGLRVWGLGIGVEGFRFRVYGLLVFGLGFRVHGLGFGPRVCQCCAHTTMRDVCCDARPGPRCLPTDSPTSQP